MNDVLICLSATKLGLPAVITNRIECDLIQQIAPGGAFVHFIDMPRGGRRRSQSPGSWYVRIVCAELYDRRAGHDAYRLLRQTRQRYLRPDAIGHKQGAKAIGCQSGSANRIVVANDPLAFGVEVNTGWSLRRQPNTLRPRQRFSDDADQRLRIKLNLASVGDADLSGPQSALIAQRPLPRHKFLGRHTPVFPPGVSRDLIRRV